MASSGPYYQSVQAPEQTTSDEYKLTQGLLEYGALAPQASMYPEPNQAQMNSEYHPQPLVDNNDAEDHAQLQGLVEAATSAAAQEQARQRSHQPALYPQPDDAQPAAADDEMQLATLLRDSSRSSAKRKRSLSVNPVDPAVERGASTSPPAPPPPPPLPPPPPSGAPTAASDRPKRQKRAVSGPGQVQESDPAFRQYQSPIESPHHLDARAAGVHSAAALFRPASDLSKKYTRPPMSKLFASLELSPENFLYLQAAAKQYMLDPAHPYRQSCVGNRGRGDSDMVKLKLHHCVREFLEQGGWGEKYFGANAPPPGEPDDQGVVPTRQRQYIWPHEKDRIIALCTPLLRRMVTNERQRQYAIESRKGGKQDKSSAEASANQNHDQDSMPESEHAMQDSQHPYDPRLAHGPAFQLYMLNRNDKQPLRDRIDYSPHENFDWHFLTQELHKFWCETMQLDPSSPEIATDFFETSTIKVLTSGGLTTVSNAGEWQLASQDADQTIWLDGLTKIIVECAV